MYSYVVLIWLHLVSKVSGAKFMYFFHKLYDGNYNILDFKNNNIGLLSRDISFAFIGTETKK